MVFKKYFCPGFGKGVGPKKKQEISPSPKIGPLAGGEKTRQDQMEGLAVGEKKKNPREVGISKIVFARVRGGEKAPQNRLIRNDLGGEAEPRGKMICSQKCVSATRAYSKKKEEEREKQKQKKKKIKEPSFTRRAAFRKAEGGWFVTFRWGFWNPNEGACAKQEERSRRAVGKGPVRKS